MTWYDVLVDVLPIISIVIGYLVNKWREREAELRKEKIQFYKKFTESLSGVLENEVKPGGQEDFSLASNNLNLIAPQNVLEALNEFRDRTKMSNLDRTGEEHDRLLSALFYAIRKDLHISPADDEDTLSIRLWDAHGSTSRENEPIV